MRMKSPFIHLFLTLALLLGKATPDPDPLQDYCIADNQTPRPFYFNGFPCINPKLALPSHFTTSVLAKPGNTKDNPFGFNATRANTLNLPGLNTLGLTMGRVDIAPNGLVPLHSHPRASEVTICLKGLLLVGFLDTSNHVFTQQLKPGESFVFPKSLVHFLYNYDSNSPAVTLTGFSSQNPGVQIVPLSSFTSNPPIDTEILKKGYQISNRDVARIRKNLGG